MKLVLAGVLLLLTAAVQAAPLPLPPGYPTLLGASCGGVHIDSYANGFNDQGVTGEIYAWTRCGGSGRGGGYRSTLYARWTSITWPVTACVPTATKTCPPPYVLRPFDGGTVDPGLVFTDELGNTASTLCNGSCRAQLVTP